MKNNGNIRIVAVTVTYNNAKILIKTVEALLSQTYNLAKIVIVDNASNDENKKIISDIKDKSDKIIVLELGENTGGAGGFEHGMRYVDKNLTYDYIWIMDDDAYPNDNCLENLLEYSTLEKVGVLCPIIYGIDNNEYQLYHHKYLKRFLTKDKMAYSSYDKIPNVGKVEANAFVGPLIPKYVIDDIGFPDGRLFIYGDDTEYTYRISRKYNAYLIKNAIINHKDANASISINPKSLWKDYYMYRNRFLLVNKYMDNTIIRHIAYIITMLGMTKRFLKVLLTLKNKFDASKYYNMFKNAASNGMKNIYI